MMENREYLNALFDIYYKLLTKTEQETFRDYYREDLSLKEIADNKNITRSSVGKTLKSATNKLLEFEAILHNYESKKILNEAIHESNIDKIKAKLKLINDIM